MVFVAFCHTLDIDHVKSYFIFFAMNIKVMVISWGKASQHFNFWTSCLSVSAKNTKIFSLLGQIQSRSDGVCVILLSFLRLPCER